MTVGAHSFTDVGCALPITARSFPTDSRKKTTFMFSLDRQLIEWKRFVVTEWLFSSKSRTLGAEHKWTVKPCWGLNLPQRQADLRSQRKPSALVPFVRVQFDPDQNHGFRSLWRPHHFFIRDRETSGTTNCPLTTHRWETHLVLAISAEQNSFTKLL